MKGFNKVFIGLAIAGAVGITYVLNSFKNFPDIFDLTDENEEDGNEF